MAFSLFKQQKNILMLSDDVLSVFVGYPQGMRLVKSVSWSDPDFETSVLNVLSTEGKGRPVTVLNDMLEQHYRKERVT